MKAYREVWDEQNNRFTYAEFDIKHASDFDSIPETNLYDTVHSYNPYESEVEKRVKEDNEKLESGKLKVIKCKDCGKFFIQTEEEIEWFNWRDMNPPKRCYDCRRRKKKTVNG